MEMGPEWIAAVILIILLAGIVYMMVGGTNG
jgi:hypothetical protein